MAETAFALQHNGKRAYKAGLTRATTTKLDRQPETAGAPLPMQTLLRL